MDKLATAAVAVFAYVVWPVLAGLTIAWWVILYPLMKEVKYAKQPAGSK